MITPGTKVHYIDKNIIRNLIAVQDNSVGLFQIWKCVDPFNEISDNIFFVHQYFEEDLKIGWK